MKKSENKQYFGDKEEQAVIDYILSDSRELKNNIYNEILIEPFRKMIESILRRYPIHIGNYEMSEVESNALTHLIEHMIRYRKYILQIEVVVNEEIKWVKLDDTHRFIYYEDAKLDLDKILSLDDGCKYRILKSKAFSYCQTIIRNYYRDHGKKSYSDVITNLPFDNYTDEVTKKTDYIYEMNDTGETELEKLINIVVDKIEDKIEGDELLKKNEVIVGDAIVNVLKNWHVLFMEDTPEGKYNKRVTNKFAKNKILLFLKEQTGLTTKEIRLAIKPFKEIYFIEKVGYLEDQLY